MARIAERRLAGVEQRYAMMISIGHFVRLPKRSPERDGISKANGGSNDVVAYNGDFLVKIDEPGDGLRRHKRPGCCDCLAMGIRKIPAPAAFGVLEQLIALPKMEIK